MQSYRLQHPTIGDVTVKISGRAHRIALRVKLNGEVELTTPLRGVSQSEALAFLESKLEWVQRSKLKMQRRVAEAPAKREFSCEELMELYLQAEAYLPSRVEHIAKQCGFKYSGMRISKARSKWGSCRADNQISLSFYLMILPKHLIDYVIIHELSHTIHHNHSERFHALVNRVVGGRERELHQELKSYRVSN